MKNSLRLSLLALALLAALGTGWRMHSLFQNEQLWGHLPLWFFVSAWASVVLIFWKKHTRHPKGARWLGLSTLGGAMLAAGFPPLPFTPLMFFGWVPLLIVEHEISQEREGASKKLLMRYCYHFFVVWNVLATYWVGNTAFIAGIVAIWANSFLMSVPFLAFHQVKKVLPRLGLAAFISFWIAFELLHLNWEMSWSWLTLGNAFARFPSWVQWYEWTGVFGGTLWILLANVLVFKLVRDARQATSSRPASWAPAIWQNQKGKVLQVAALILLPILASLLLYFNQKDKGREVEVVVVQPNYEPHYQKFETPVREQVEHFLKLSAQAVTDSTEYLVWPETSFSGGHASKLESHPVVRQLKRFLEKHPRLKLVAGISAYKIFEPDEKRTRSTRKEIQGTDTIFWEAYNAAIQLEPGVDSVAFYIKSKLVPGAEILPYHEVFFFLKPLAEKLDGSVEGHGIQPQREAFASSSGKVAPVICYESVFGDYHAGYVRAGAEATFIMTNDGWWDNTAGHKQHLQFASLRAIETRRSIARSANTGVSAFLNQRGDILQPTKYEVEAAIRGKIRLNGEVTFYVRWGDLIGRLGVFVTAVLLLNTVAKGVLKQVRRQA